jgi:hypothetical protein
MLYSEVTCKVGLGAIVRIKNVSIEGLGLGLGLWYLLEKTLSLI